MSAGWVASNPATPNGPATYTYGSGLLNATDNTGTAYYTRDPGGTLISQRLPGGTVNHYLLNGQGDVVKLVDPGGNVVATYQYCPTGNASEPATGPAAAGNPYLQDGNLYEPGTQNYVLPNGTRVDANSGNTTQRSADLSFTPLFQGASSFNDPTQCLRSISGCLRFLYNNLAKAPYSVYYYSYMFLSDFGNYLRRVVHIPVRQK